MHTRVRLMKLVRILGCWAGLALIIACGFMEMGETASPAPAPVVAEPGVAEAPVAEPSGGGGGACSRISGCCRAYIAAMGASVPASTCDAYDNVVGMQDSVCESAIAGYRSGLQAMQKAVPSECN